MLFDFPNEEGSLYKSSGEKMVWNKELKREIPALWEVRQVNDIAGFFSGLFRQPTAEEFLYLRTYLVHVLLDEVGADVGGTRDEEQFLVSGAGGLVKGFLRHVATVGNLAGDNKQGLRDEAAWSVASQAIMSISELFR